MSKEYVATVFMNGGSQAIRIPKELRVKTSKVKIRENEKSNCLEVREFEGRSLDEFFRMQDEVLSRVSSADAQALLAVVDERVGSDLNAESSDETSELANLILAKSKKGNN